MSQLANGQERTYMKGTITQYIMVGVMLLLMALIVSLYPAQTTTQTGSEVSASTKTKVSTLNLQSWLKPVRAD